MRVYCHVSLRHGSVFERRVPELGTYIAIDSDTKETERFLVLGLSGTSIFGTLAGTDASWCIDSAAYVSLDI